VKQLAKRPAQESTGVFQFTVSIPDCWHNIMQTIRYMLNKDLGFKRAIVINKAEALGTKAKSFKELLTGDSESSNCQLNRCSRPEQLY
jgi:hypothetical protein